MATSLCNVFTSSCSIGASRSENSVFLRGSVALPQQKIGASASRVTLDVCARKKWEKPALTKNGKLVRHNMNVKSGDTVIVRSGFDKGTVTKVLKVFPTENMIVAENVNIKTKNIKPQGPDVPGRQEQLEFPIHVSNVMHYSKTKKVASRLKKVINDEGKKVRVLVKTGEVLPN